jgi:DNA-binding beta-propeller fold protein YncE
MRRSSQESHCRRRFLFELGAGLAAGAVLPRASFAGGAASGDPLVLGTGAHRYRWVRGWGELPAGMGYGGLHGGVAVDGQGHVYLSTDGEGSILVFDRDGKLVRSMGREWRPVEAGQGTHDLQLNREGGQDFLYIVSLFRHEFAKLTTKGEVVYVKGFPQESGVYKSKEEFAPTGIAVASNGDVYVTDGYGANYVHRYDAKGGYVSSWGGKSSAAREDGKFSTPHKIAIDARGSEPSVLVTDRANHRLQWFTLDGRHLRTLDGSANDLLRLPSTLSFRGGTLAIGDLKGRLTLIGPDDTLLAQLGDSGNEAKQATNKVPPAEWVDGQFIAPHGVAWDGDESLYVSEWSLVGRVVKLARVA